MFNIFGNNEKAIELLAPVTGELIELSEVPDKVFAAKIVGDGIAIKPADNKIVAPATGVIKQLFPTKHALGIETKAGVEVLIHIGIDTVELEGKGFKSSVKQDDEVNVGDELIKFDLDYISENASSIITPVVIINQDDIDSFEVVEDKRVTAGEDKLLKIKL
jgi:glucose-specific phosphotransferase system IIA component